MIIRKTLFLTIFGVVFAIWLSPSIGTTIIFSLPQVTDSGVRIVAPVEGQSIPCIGPDDETCIMIYADDGDYSGTYVEARFQWSPSGTDPWYHIDDVIGSNDWSTCWDNTGLVEDGDTIYFRVIAHDEYYMADTSSSIRIFVDCQALNARLTIEDVFTNCCGIVKVVGSVTLKATEDTLLDIFSVDFYYKLHSDPDMFQYWQYAGQGELISDNVWSLNLNADSLPQSDYYDIRAISTSLAGNVLFDLDEDGLFNDSTFIAALVQGSAKRIFVDNKAPQPAFSLVADTACSVSFVNPSLLLGGNGKAYTKAGDYISMEVLIFPSQDTCEVCEVWKVEYYGGEYCDPILFHLGNSVEPYNYTLDFEPITMELIQPWELEDGWWRGRIRALLYDSLNNSKGDTIELFVLDINPSQAIIVEPLIGSILYNEVPIKSAALNPYEISEVTYQHRHQDSLMWTNITDGTSSEPDSFPIIWDVSDIPAGLYLLRVVAKDSLGTPDPTPPTIQIWVNISPSHGDANGDGVIDFGDAIYILNYLFKGRAAPNPLDAGDVNCDGLVNLSDVIYLLNYIFRGGQPPCEP